MKSGKYLPGGTALKSARKVWMLKQRVAVYGNRNAYPESTTTWIKKRFFQRRLAHFCVLCDKQKVFYSMTNWSGSGYYPSAQGPFRRGCCQEVVPGSEGWATRLPTV